MGNLDEIEKNIIFNSLQESLSKFYILTSTKMYEKAEEEAFQEMDAEECTEAQCIALIQELLQVEYFFMFQILKSNDFQQLKLTRVDLDANRDVRTDTCSKCDISQINSKVDTLVQSINDEYIPLTIATNNQVKDEQIIDLSGESAGAVALWEIVKTKDEISEYRLFIEKFPNSSLTVPAEYRMNEKIRIQKEMEEQQRKEKVRKEKQSVSYIKTRWEKGECNKRRTIFEKHYLVYSFIPFHIYGVNGKSGEIVKDINTAIKLNKEGNLYGSFVGPLEADTDGNFDGISKLIMSSTSYVQTIGGVSSTIMNTSCYDTYENGHPLIIKYAIFNSKLLEEQIASAKGEYLTSILSLRGCNINEHEKIKIKIKKKYSYIYNQSTIEIVNSIKLLRVIEDILNSDPWLKANCNSYSPIDVVAVR